MGKEIKNIQYALSLLFYENENDTDKITAILEQAFTEALEFVFEHNTIDRTADKNNFKKLLLNKLYKIIKAKLKQC